MSYTGWMQVKVAKDSAAADIPTMREMGTGGYSAYVEGGLFYVDSHDVLRAVHGDYPLATTSEQIDVLIGYLEDVRARMAAAEG